MRSLLPFITPFVLTATLVAQDSIALRVGKVITNDGQVLTDATVLVEQGRITQIGDASMELPFEVLLREFPDGILFSGFYEAHTSSGTDRANENVPIAPFLDVKDSIDPVAFFYEDELRGGTVALGVIPGNNCVIGGRGRVVAPYGRTIEEMTLSASMGMKIAIGPKSRWSRAAQLAELREATGNLTRTLQVKGQALLDEQARTESLQAIDEAPEDAGDDADAFDSQGGYIRFGDDFPGKELISEEDVDSTLHGLVDVLNGDERLWLWAPEPTDVLHAISWAASHGLEKQAVYVVTSSAWKVAEELSATEQPVVLSGGMWHVETDSVSEKETKTFAPTVLADAGVTLSLGTNKNRLGPDRLAYIAATCVREGMSYESALAAVTTNPAAAWGLGDELGKIAIGYEGNFVLLDGEPLDLATKVLGVWIRGNRVYDRADDGRLERLETGASK